MKVLFPLNAEINNIEQTKSLEIYNEDVIEFLNGFSKLIIKDTRVKQFPDVATFGFFCRKANITNIKNRYYDENEIRIGKGVVFHIAPSNVPVNFAYSFVCGLLSGNLNIVKVPSQEFEQIDIIADALNKMLDKFQDSPILNKLYLVRYSREDVNTTKLFSSFCDVRVIWGGDQTIDIIRENPIPAKSFDITFADRYSICAIQAKEFIRLTDDRALIRGFYNDTYLFDQNACTAPHMIVWVGQEKDIKLAKIKFWNSLDNYLNSNGDSIEAVVAVDKLTTFLEHSIVSENKPVLYKMENNLIWRSEVNELEKDLHQYKCNSGYFLEYSTESLDEIDKIITRKFQTLSYFGFSKEELRNFFLNTNPLGVDRIVPIGRTVDFEIVWDGYNLIEKLSRICVIN